MAKRRVRRRRLPEGSGRRIALLVTTGLGVPLVSAGALGMPVLQALLAGAACVAIVAPWGRPPLARDVTFPIRPTPPTNRGTRREAFQLSWSVASGDDRVGAQLIKRIRSIAERRLAAHGLHLSDPSDKGKIVQRIGDQAYQVLTTPPGMDVPQRHFREALIAVEQLGPAAPHALENDQSEKEHG